MSIVLLEEMGMPLMAEGEEIFHRVEKVTLFRKADEGSGRLFVTNQRVVWVRDGAVESGLGWGFRDIALHAVARQNEEIKRPSIYCQLAVAGDPDEPVDPEELRFIPESDLAINDLFENMNKGAALCPDEGGPMDCDDDLEIDLSTPGVNLMQFADAAE